MATPNYNVNYDDKRFTQVTNDKKAALDEIDKTYGEMIGQSDSFYNSQINAARDWADKQTELQNAQTDFAIEKIEQQKEQTKKDYIKEQSGAYVDWQKQSNQFGAGAEQMVAQGMAGTGYSESSQVSMYNQYQIRIATAREAYVRAVQNYDNAMTDARLKNSAVLAEIAYEALQKELELSLAGFQYKNSLVIDQANKKMELENQYYDRWQDVLKQINTENAMAEEVRQFDASMKQQQAELAEQQRQFNERMAYQKAKDAAASATISNSSGSSSRSSSSSSKSRTSKGDNSEKIKSGSSSVKKTTSSNSSAKSSTPEIDMQSVLALGLGPISAKKLDSLVASGVVREYVSGGKTKFAYTASGLKQKQLYSGLR